MQFDQYSLLAIHLKKIWFSAKNSKLKKKVFHLFVELFETNPLMNNIKDSG